LQQLSGGACRLFGIADGIRIGQVFASAIEVGLFDFIGETAKTEKEIAHGLYLTAPRLEDFLNAIVSMGYLTKNKDDKYSNT
jgi:hypothetical protein